MKVQKLLENKRNENPADKKQKAELLPTTAPAKFSEQRPRFLAPFQLELAGNRLSPLHEW